MATLERPSTSCNTHRPPLTDGDQQANNAKYSLSRSYTFDGGQSAKQYVHPHYQQQQQQQQPQQRATKSLRASPSSLDQQSHRLGRSLLSNDNWRQETMADVRINAKAIEQSDQNVLFGKGQ